MGIADIYSNRLKNQSDTGPDIYCYDEIPNTLRVQICHILDDSLGTLNEEAVSYFGVKAVYEFLFKTLTREYGVFQLTKTNHQYYHSRIHDFILKEPIVERVLDVIELSSRLLERAIRDQKHKQSSNQAAISDEAVLEINERFKAHGIGYRYENGYIIRIDSELIHKEVVKPCLKLLSDTQYAGANQEFLTAHEHFRHDRNRDCLTSCLAAIESTLKIINTLKGWGQPKRQTSSGLIDHAFQNGLIPEFWANYFSGIRTILESGVPTVRNKLGSHGQGDKIVDIPAEIVSFALNQTASVILFLVSSANRYSDADE